jgi:hypothetical protein
MMLKAAKIALVLVLFVVVLSIPAAAQSFGYEIIKSPAGKLILTIKTDVPDQGLFLGVSLYPPNVLNTLEQGKHFSVPVKPGVFKKEFEIDRDFEGGTFEAGLWKNKLTGADCPPDDLVCKKLGYKHTGMAGYIWGVLATRLR